MAGCDRFINMTVKKTDVRKREGTTEEVVINGQAYTGCMYNYGCFQSPEQLSMIFDNGTVLMSGDKI